MFQHFFAVQNFAPAILCTDQLSQIANIAHKTEGKLLTCPRRTIELYFFPFIEFTNLHGSIYDLFKFHYLSSNPKTTGNNCFLRETTPGASRVPSANGG